MTKTIIGLTGNIATAKSVVRRMLTNTDALGLDADVIAQRLYYKDGPAYEQIIDSFGLSILSADGQISRPKLGQIVFSDEDQLRVLESILHPLVTADIMERIDQSQSPIIVIEAIKLLESGLDHLCDWIWVSDASTETQLARLMLSRNLTKQEALLRIASQTPQIEKRKRADIVINTEGSFFDTWQQVISALNDTIQAQDYPSLNLNTSQNLVVQAAGKIPDNQLADFWEEQTQEGLETLYELLGLKLCTVILNKFQIEAIITWQEWNFTATLKQVILASATYGIADEILKAFEYHSQVQQCEILFISQDFPWVNDINLTSAGYHLQPVDELNLPHWQIAGKALTQDSSSEIWVKILTSPGNTLLRWRKASIIFL